MSRATTADDEYVEAQDVRRTPFRIAIAPLPSLQCALRDAAGAGRAGTPQVWCDAIRVHLRGRDYETLAPFVRPGPMMTPDPLMGLAEAPGESFESAVERMLATPVEVLVEEFAVCGAIQGPAIWADASRDPAGWLRRYVAALLRAWKGFGPIFNQARSALDREIERIGTATALDGQLELLDGLFDDGAVVDGRWRVACHLQPGRAGFPDSGLTLVPLVAGERSSILARSDDVISSVSYPLRLCSAPAAVTRALEGLLGVPRAQILRAAARPITIGRLAELLRTVPSAATHHVGALEAADLVDRIRSGRNVLVRRTARGEGLVDLYESHD